MIAALIGYILPYLVAALAGLAGLWGYGKVKQRQGMAEEREKQTAKDAESKEEAHERITKADTGAGLPDDSRRDRLRDFAAKHGTRPPKAGGR